MDPCSNKDIRLADIKNTNPPVVKVALKLRDPQGTQGLTAKVLDTASGSYNLVYTVLFSDGTQVVVKINQAAHRKGKCACWTEWRPNTPFRMESEVRTLRQIKRLTTIPVPIVYGFNSSFDNELGFPYMVMELLPGRSAWYMWRETVEINAENYRLRTNFLNTLAGYVLQLNQFVADDLGYPVWDGSKLSVVPQHDYPLDSRLAGIRPLTSVPGRDLLRAALLGYNARELPPLGRSDPRLWAYSYLLREATFWLPVHASETGDFRAPAVLAHPDLDLQNILVDRHYNITGLIDWDGIRAVPRVLGNEAFPRWLIIDCIGPRKYHYQILPDGTVFNRASQDSPGQMVFWRSRWVDVIANHFKADPNMPVVAAGHAARSVYFRLLEVFGLPHFDTTRWAIGGFLEHVLRDPTFTSTWRETDFLAKPFPPRPPPQPVTLDEVIRTLYERKASPRQWGMLQERFSTYDFAIPMRFLIETERNARE